MDDLTQAFQTLFTRMTDAVCRGDGAAAAAQRARAAAAHRLVAN